MGPIYAPDGAHVPGDDEVAATLAPPVDETPAVPLSEDQPARLPSPPPPPAPTRRPGGKGPWMVAGAAILVAAVVVVFAAVRITSKERARGTKPKNSAPVPSRERAGTTREVRHPKSVADITVADLYEAVFTPEEALDTVFPKGETWPRMPQMHLGTKDPRMTTTPKFWVAQSYEQLGQTGTPFENTLLMYESERVAREEFSAMLGGSDKDTTPMQGPAVGDETRYYQRSVPQATCPDCTPFDQYNIRFRVGPVIGRVGFVSPFADPQAPEGLAKWAGPVVDRLHKLLDLDLVAPRLPNGFAGRLPGTVGEADEIVGTVVVPVEAWIDVSDGPQAERVLANYHEAGVKDVAVRRFNLRGRPDDSLEVVLFPFEKAAAANKAVEDTRGDLLSRDFDTYDAGNTGDNAFFAVAEFAELQFARGPDMGDVSCFAEFAERAENCEGAVVDMAEAWYRRLG